MRIEQVHGEPEGREILRQVHERELRVRHLSAVRARAAAGYASSYPARASRAAASTAARPAAAAPKSSRNALKHGRYTREEIVRRKAVNAVIREAWRTVRQVEREK